MSVKGLPFKKLLEQDASQGVSNKKESFPCSVACTEAGKYIY